MAIVFCHKERGISVEEENHLVTVGIVKKSKTILVLLASPSISEYGWSMRTRGERVSDEDGMGFRDAECGYHNGYNRLVC